HNRQTEAQCQRLIYSERLLAYLTVRYMARLPFIDQIRSRQELNLVQSIRRKLKKAKLILSIEHLTKIDAYEELPSGPNPLHEQFNKENTPLRPIMNTIHAATTKISKFLDRLIRPLFDRYARQTTIILSFLSDHPRHIFRNVIRIALTRAIRYSSTFEAFNIEQRQVRLKLLYNGYPSIYINKQFQQFFLKHMSSSFSSSSSSLLPMIDDENQFFLLRQILLAEPTPKQTQVAKSAATVDIMSTDHDNNNVQGMIRRVVAAARTTTTTSTKMITIKSKADKFNNTLFIHCTHEGRLADLKQDIHEIHDSYVKNTQYEQMQLVVSHHNNPNMDFELARKRPSQSILKDQPNKPKNQYTLRIEFERRRGMLKFDAKDHQYIEIFNKLKPRQPEISLTKSIWKATNDEQNTSI
ncbi:unnamed protein product, partial [Didymodactylos carnosus]